MNVVSARRRGAIAGREADIVVHTARPKHAAAVDVGKGFARGAVPTAERVRVRRQPHREMQFPGGRVAMVHDPIHLQRHLVSADAIRDRTLQNHPTDAQSLGERQQVQTGVEVGRLRDEDMDVVSAWRRTTVLRCETDVLVAPSGTQRARAIDVGKRSARDRPAVSVWVGALRQPHRYVQLARMSGALVLDAIDLDGDHIVRDAVGHRALHLDRTRSLHRSDATRQHRE